MPSILHGRGARLAVSAAVAGAVWLSLSARFQAQATQAADEPLGAPPLYDELREATLEPAGHIRDGRLRVDRFTFELTDGALYLLEPVGGRVTGAVFLGRGLIRAYPPDAVEHQQIKKLLDADFLEERFERLVLRFTDDTADRLRALAAPSAGGDTGKANDVFADRRDLLFKDQMWNPDSRVFAGLIERGPEEPDGPGAAVPATGPAYFLAIVDGQKHGWFTVEIEPRDLEAVRVSRYDSGHNLRDVWMGAHALAGLDGDPFGGFPVDPASLDKKPREITGADLGLPARPREPVEGAWAPAVDVPIVTVDAAFADDGRSRGTAALLVEPRRPMRAIRLRISPFLQVTDARWRAAEPLGPDALDLLAGRPHAGDAADPATVSGDRLFVVQQPRPRVLGDDLFEPWVTVVLPRQVSPDDRFVLELAYEGKVVEKLRGSGDHLLRDTLYWLPRHPDARRSRFHLTFRVPRRDGIASPGEPVDDRVDGNTRIVRRVVRAPIAHVSFHYGRFDVTRVELDGVPPITVYGNARTPGFAPGNREKTVADLADSIRTYREYFGPYPFPSLHVTETPALNGQAFAGFVLLSFQAFGELYTGEAELFRAHEVAHQWWGAGVEWRDYRDQWLSEGFAQYAAALYVASGLGELDKFHDMIAAWRRDVLGEMSIGQGTGLAHYGFRPAVIRKSQASASGPLVAGFRLQSTRTPFDYRLIVYEKGALILHMLRMMLRDPVTGDDEPFRALMRSFASRHMHGVVATRDFEAAVSAAFGQPMDWFFDQWVYGVEIPTYRPQLRVSPLVDSRAPFLLHGTITQEDVPDGFRMLVPIVLRFADRPPIVHRVWIDRPTVTVELPLPARPSTIAFNDGDSVLARVR